MARVEDKGGLVDYTQVKIDVVNVNDNAPIIQSPSSVKVSPGHDIAQPIATITVRLYYYHFYYYYFIVVIIMIIIIIYIIIIIVIILIIIFRLMIRMVLPLS